MNKALTGKIDATCETRDSEKNRDHAFQSENSVVTNSYIERTTLDI